MYFDLDGEQREFVATVEAFAAKEIAPGAVERDRTGEWFAQGWRQMGELGLLGLQFPEAYGGSGASIATTAAAFQAFTAGGADAGIALSWVAHSVLAGTPLWLFGSDDQKRRYLSKIATGEWTAGYGLTEPQAGSDAASMQTTAVQRGDRWILNGSKMFITNAPVGDVFVVFASEDRSLRSGGVTAFVVERGFPGFSSGPALDKMGNRTSPTGELIFQDCEVPAENVLGERRRGFAIAKTALEWERFLMMAHSVGTMQAVLRDCRQYASERRQFGKPILEQPAIRGKLADMRLRIAAGELFVRRVAWLKDQRQATPLESSSCKIFCSAAVMQSTLQGVQVYGGYGYIREHAVERAMRDAKLAEIGGGTTEIQRQVVGRALLAQPDQRWDRSYTPEQIGARSRPASEAGDLTGAALAVAELSRQSLGLGLAAAAHETVRWALRLTGQDSLLAPSRERLIAEPVAEPDEALTGAVGGRRPDAREVMADSVAEPDRAQAGAGAGKRSGAREVMAEPDAVVASLGAAKRPDAREVIAELRRADPVSTSVAALPPMQATYSLAGELVVNAHGAQALLRDGRLSFKPAGWQAVEASEVLLAPEARLGRVKVHGQGQEVADGAGVDPLGMTSRLFLAASACGAAEAALDEALDGAREAEHDQLVEFALADIRTRVDGARLLTHRAAELIGRADGEALAAAREARVFSAEAAVFCVEQAVSVAGALRTARLQELQRDVQLLGSLDEPLAAERLALAAQPA